MLSTTKQKNNKSTGRSATGNGNTGKKIARDLREEFQEFQLREHDADEKEIKERDQQQNQNRQADQQVEQQQEQQNKKERQSRSRQSSSTHKQFQLSNKKPLRNSLTNSNSNPKINIKSLLSHSHNNTQVPQVPRSYLLALEHLQDALSTKDTEIHTLKSELLEKQQIIYECESKINEVLVKYHELLDLYGFKESEIKVLKDQMEELRRDRQVALRQAAKAMQGEFRDEMAIGIGVGLRNGYVDQGAFTTFKNRAMSTHLGPYSREPLMTDAYSKEILHPYPPPPSQTPNLKHSNLTSTQLYKPSQQLLSKPQPKNKTSRPPHSIPSPLNSPALLPPQKQKDRDFISYQREILRNQKQLIALKYRMECLERKLSTNPKEENVKQKIRKLSEEIDSKERIIGDLKRI